MRGLKLADVGDGDPAAHLRPTTDRVRESIFNLLVNGSHGNPIAGARVLDLFAGTGALGLEALSRGAAHVAFVDDGHKSRSLIRQNVERARATEKTEMWRRDATNMGEHRGEPFTLIFLDPPYATGKGELALASAAKGGFIAAGATIVWEESRPPLIPVTVRLLEQRTYGDTVVTMIRWPE
jgi:16S rRNA (guanine966-N2)-methyltransferase